MIILVVVAGIVWLVMLISRLTSSDEKSIDKNAEFVRASDMMTKMMEKRVAEGINNIGTDLASDSRMMAKVSNGVKVMNFVRKDKSTKPASEPDAIKLPANANITIEITKMCTPPSPPAPPEPPIDNELVKNYRIRFDKDESFTNDFSDDLGSIAKLEFPKSSLKAPGCVSGSSAGKRVRLNLSEYVQHGDYVSEFLSYHNYSVNYSL